MLLAVTPISQARVDRAVLINEPAAAVSVPGLSSTAVPGMHGLQELIFSGFLSNLIICRPDLKSQAIMYFNLNLTSR